MSDISLTGMPERDGDELFLTTVAWLYYVEGLTQSEVADRIRATRIRVNKALGEARRRGLVRIEVVSASVMCLDLRARIKERFNLKDAMVAPSPSSPGTAQMSVGAALGHYLNTLFLDHKTNRLAVSWGETLAFASRAILPVNRPGLEVISMMGGLTSGTAINSFEITSSIAKALGARYSFLAAPVYAGSRETRDEILGIDVFRDVLAQILRVDAASVSAGDMTTRSLLIRDGLPEDIRVEDLIGAGAVGDILGVFLDADGHPIDHPINGRAVGVSIEQLRRMTNVILGAGGVHKWPIITAALATGAFDVLVTDAATASVLLGEDPGKFAGEPPPPG